MTHIAEEYSQLFSTLRPFVLRKIASTCTLSPSVPLPVSHPLLQTHTHAKVVPFGHIRGRVGRQ